MMMYAPMLSEMQGLRVTALAASHAFGVQVAKVLGVGLTTHEEREFDDGEHKARVLHSVRGCDVYVIQSLHRDGQMSVNDKLMRLLLFIGALKDASARSVTAVVPYLCYARKDQKSKSRDPISLRYVAQLFEAVGTDRIVTLDVHNLAAYQNAFRIPSEHWTAKRLFLEHILRFPYDAPIVVVSPDIGGVKRAEAFRAALEQRIERPVGMAFMEKYRSAGVVSGEVLVGEVREHHVIVMDDLVSSGTTLLRAIHACREGGATRIDCAATHGLFTGDVMALLQEQALDRLIVTDTIAPPRLPPKMVSSKLVVLSVAPLVAEGIHRLHSNTSIVEWLKD